jgi:broad specificity phosphatase PhoE
MIQNLKNRYFLMRHGESQANKQQLIISDPAIGCKLYGLTVKGREQAKESIAKSGLSKNTVIVSSDFTRARETAKVAQDVLRCGEIILRPGLRERFFGKLEGRSSEEYRNVWAHDDVDSLNTPFGAESPRYLAHRLCRVVSDLETLYEGELILLVSHGDPLRFLQLRIADRDLTEHMKIRHFAPAEIRPLEKLPTD